MSSHKKAGRKRAGPERKRKQREREQGACPLYERAVARRQQQLLSACSAADEEAHLVENDRAPDERDHDGEAGPQRHGHRVAQPVNGHVRKQLSACVQSAAPQRQASSRSG